MIPTVSSLFIWNPFNETKSLSGTSNSPYELAQKSLSNLNLGIFNFLANQLPSINPHFLTLAILRELFLTGPAIATDATYGYTYTSSRNFFRHYPKSGSLATRKSAFLITLQGWLQGGFITTSQRRMFVPPTSPNRAHFALNYWMPY